MIGKEGTPLNKISNVCSAACTKFYPLKVHGVSKTEYDFCYIDPGTINRRLLI
jgi:hypothetical protein